MPTERKPFRPGATTRAENAAGVPRREKLTKVGGEVEVFAAQSFMAGYSGTPLVRKLGIRPGERVIAINAPPHYPDLLADLPPDVAIGSRINGGADFVHLFVTTRAELEQRLESLRKRIAEGGVVWVSWPKKSARVATDVTEDTIREVALPLGFVDVKVCAVDGTWSGLKLMIRRENRTR